MGSPATDYDLLLAAPDPFVAEMARGVLADAGIPSLIHGRDINVGELGASVQRAFTRPDLFVPKGAGARARVLLEEAFDEKALADVAFPESPSEPTLDEWRAKHPLWGPKAVGWVYLLLPLLILAWWMLSRLFPFGKR